MEIVETKLPGCLTIHIHKKEDNRGFFVKTYHKNNFKKFGLETNFVEEYYSYSVQRVVRGLHFQIPPMHHTKLVYCPFGKILDAVVDLRKGSPTYKFHDVIEISSKKGNLLYIPPGLAHGFAVLSNAAVVVYNVTTVYSPECDMGILWNSADIPWPHSSPVISERDKTLTPLKDFDSPFTY